MANLENRKVAILSTHGFEQSELEHPLKALRDAGAEVHVVAPEAGEIRGWSGTDWGDSVPVDRTLDSASAADYDALVLPGGQINPDLLRVDDAALNLVKAFWSAGKPIGAICHAPWLLVETGIVKDRDVTSYHSIRTDVENAGGKWRDAEVVTDQGLVTSRQPDDLPAFCDKLIEEIAEGRHEARAA
ncbi:protease I [Cribrihabitans marinus]|uniref:Protease I n=1 Tax=Cribrihabitans marinus TaxID=1227549 RepID=A0A1H6TLR4_9RHOB|nr:type 1 glutamine amidotransferase domain-containing protein [Cribrihabitans marinus]GGH22066.1 protease [Cribrihabitans marinus]SEI77175.1 protease I [Cribrihabitans marinus]